MQSGCYSSAASLAFHVFFLVGARGKVRVWRKKSGEVEFWPEQVGEVRNFGNKDRGVK